MAQDFGGIRNGLLHLGVSMDDGVAIIDIFNHYL